MFDKQLDRAGPADQSVLPKCSALKKLKVELVFKKQILNVVFLNNQKKSRVSGLFRRPGGRLPRSIRRAWR
ncbi:hypothetical protein, partial [Paenibacillus medicaginis]